MTPSLLDISSSSSHADEPNTSSNTTLACTKPTQALEIDQEMAALMLEDDDASIGTANSGSTTDERQPRSSAMRILCSWKDQLIQRGPAVFLVHFMMANNLKVIFASVSWYLFCLQTGMSPLFPGQWQPFAAILAGFMVFDTYLTPFRLVIAAGQAPKVDRLMGLLQCMLIYKSKLLAVAIVWVGILIINLAMLVVGVSLASYCAGVPIFEPTASAVVEQ